MRWGGLSLLLKIGESGLKLLVASSACRSTLFLFGF